MELKYPVGTYKMIGDVFWPPEFQIAVLSEESARRDGEFYVVRLNFCGKISFGIGMERWGTNGLVKFMFKEMT